MLRQEVPNEPPMNVHVARSERFAPTRPVPPTGPMPVWRLFVGDESTIPPIFAMLESLPAGARAYAFLEVQSDEHRQPLRTAADVELTWLSRGGAAAQASSPALVGAVADFELPPGVGHAYLLGETSTIRRQRHELIARGMPKDRIFGEGYWRPGRVGGHDHLVEH